MTFLLDTHVWIWAQLEPDRLSATVKALLSESDAVPCLSPISFYEVLLLAERGRIRVAGEPAEWLRISLARRPMMILDVTTEIAIGARSLSEFVNPDPFDRILLSTARVHGIPIVSKDEVMRAWGRVPIVW